MKICPKCKQVYDDNSVFCEQCENEDGAGVRLVEAKDCPNCGKTIPKDAKRCIYCGVNTQNFAKDATNMDIHGNAVRGDLNITSTVHHDETYIDNTVVHNEVTNNSTTNIIHNDETTTTSKCSVCGKIIKRIEGYECTKCGKFVCSDCYDDSEKMCTHCSPFTSAQKVSKVLEKFVKELRGYNVNDNAGWNFVEHYIIPNNKNDIKEFLVYCSSHRDALRSDDNKRISVLWNNKCLQLINQGEVAFPDDKLFQDFLKEKKTNSEAFKEKIRKERKKAIEKERKRKLREENREIKAIEKERKRELREKNRKIKAIEKERKRELREENREKIIDIIRNIISFFSVCFKKLWWLFIVCIPLLMFLCINHKAQNSIKQKVAEIQNSNPQHGIVVPKENIMMEGYIKNYLEIVEDGIYTFSSNGKDYDVCFTTKVKKIKSYLDFYEEQLKEFKSSNSIPAEKQVEIYKDYVDGNFITYYTSEYMNILPKILNDIKSRKIGDTFTISIVHREVEGKKLKTFLENPTSTVVLTSEPYFFYNPNPTKLISETYRKEIE